MENILVLDVGTSSLKAMLYNEAGRLLNRASYEYHSNFFSSSYVEQNPHSWHDALVSTLKESAEFIEFNKLHLDAIAVTSQRASVIPIDKDGRTLHNAIMWQDKRSLAQCDQLLAQLSMKDMYYRTGLRANPYFSVPKMMWLKDERREIYDKAYKLIGVQDYIVYLLTGAFVTDWSQACRTMLMNINTFSWDDDMLKISGIDKSKLAELVPPGSRAGFLGSALASSTGLPPGIPVIIGGGDQQCAALALNILRPGYAEANTGTGSFIVAYADAPTFDDECRTLCSASALPGKWIAEAGIFNTGAIHRWFKEQAYPEGEAVYDLMNKDVEESPVGANGVIMLSHFEGSAAPYWNPLAKGLFFNLSLGTKRSDMTRAILEGIAMEIGHNISLIENLVKGISTVSVAGGLVAFDLFNQIQSDCFNKTVIRYDNNEASSLGALMSAMVTLDVYRDYDEAFRAITPGEPIHFTPNQLNAEKYQALFKRKDALYQALNQSNIYDMFKNPI